MKYLLTFNAAFFALYITTFSTFLLAEERINLVINGINFHEDKLEGPKVSLSLDILNNSTNSVSLLAHDCNAGWHMIRFYFIDKSGARLYLTRRSFDVTGPLIAISTIKSQGSVTYLFDLRDGTWDWPGFMGAGECSEIVAELSIPVVLNAEFNELWSGHASSPPFRMQDPLHVIFPRETLLFRNAR